jgi:hypothetical protein
MGGGMAMAGIGGGMGGGGFGGDADESSKPANFRNRLQISQLSAALAVADSNPQNKELLKRLEEPVAMSFAEATSLEDVLKHLKTTTKGSIHRNPIPIYVDPKGLADAEVSLGSPVSLDLPGIPLRTSLRLMLKQLGLAYCVRDGVLIISSVQGIREELAEAARELLGTGNDKLDQQLIDQMGIGPAGGMGGGMR